MIDVVIEHVHVWAVGIPFRSVGIHSDTIIYKYVCGTKAPMTGNCVNLGLSAWCQMKGCNVHTSQ